MTAILAILLRIPFIGNIVAFASEKKRLFIEYLMIGIVIALAAFVFTLWLEKRNTDKQMQNMIQTLNQLQIENSLQDGKIETQDKTIQNLETLRKIDTDVLNKLNQHYLDLYNSKSEFKRKIDNLEKTNEPVRNYLDSDIPSELECLFNKTCKADSNNKN